MNDPQVEPPAYERLLAYGKLYETRQNKARQQKIDKDEEECIYNPQLSEGTRKRDRSFDSGETILERFARQSHNTEKRIQEARTKQKTLEENELSSITFRPIISPLAKRKGSRSIDHQAEIAERFLNQKARNVEICRRKWTDPWDDNTDRAPVIDSRSRYLAQHTKRCGMKTEEWLHFSGKAAQVKKWIMSEVSRLENLGTFSPSINTSSRSLSRNGNVHERLFNDSIRYEMMNNARRIEDVFRVSEKRRSSSANSIDSSGRPEIRKSNSCPQRLNSKTSNREIIELFEERMRKWEKQVLDNRRDLLQKHSPSFKPKLNKRSVELHMTSTRGIRKQEKDRRKSVTEELSFRPSLNPRSVALAQRSTSQLRSKVRVEKAVEEVKALRNELREREEKECTFNPITLGSSSPTATVQNLLPLLERVEIWQENKVKKNAAQVQMKKNEVMKECTFKPSVNHRESGELSSAIGSSEFDISSVHRDSISRTPDEEEVTV